MASITRVLSALPLVLGFARAATAQLTSTGASVTLDGISYFIDPYPAGNFSDDFIHTLAHVPSAFGLKPVTVVAEETAPKCLEALFTKWTKTDDVFQAAFLQGVFLAGLRGDDVQQATYLGTHAAVLPLGAHAELASGPYFLDTATGAAHRAYRLYDDFAGAFTESLLQTADGAFQPLSAQVATSVTLTIGVPSRLYYTPSKEQPLAGVRVGVKDIYNLKGVKNSNGNRAWYHLYPANEQTAPAIQRLIDAGAVIVGLQVPSQFANGETATADWVDYHSPFNPRGDGYNQPSSSSSGAGASIGSYDWLDLAVGSDTGGSIRGPAGAQGLFGNRPSHGLVTLDDVMPLSPAMDTPGFLTRDPYLWDRAQAAMYGANYTSWAGKQPKYPATLWTLGFPTSTSSPADKMLVDFADAVAEFVGAGKPEALDLDSMWADSKPGKVGANVTLDELLTLTYPTLIAKNQIELLREPFYADYAAKFNGLLPFVDPAPLNRWAYGDSVPDSATADALGNKTIFMDWFGSRVLAPRPKTCSSAIVLYVGSDGGPSPRNRYIDAPTAPFGFSSGRISPFSEVPDVVFPLGDVEAASSITKGQQLLPVAVDVMAAKGCDGLVARLAQQLSEKGVVAVPEVGSSLEGGEILFKRGVEAFGLMG